MCIQVDHCCGWIPLRIGTHIIGVSLACSVIFTIYQINQALNNDAGLAVNGFIIYTVCICVPLIKYYQMLLHNSNTNKRNFAEAYNKIMKWTIIIFGIIVCIYQIFNFFKRINMVTITKNAARTKSLKILVVYSIWATIQLHFMEVVKAYSIAESQKPDEEDYIKALEDVLK